LLRRRQIKTFSLPVSPHDSAEEQSSLLLGLPEINLKEVPESSNEGNAEGLYDRLIEGALDCLDDRQAEGAVEGVGGRGSIRRLR
jgi:hypothetical protein